jgi:hypothetical protein
MHSPPRVPTWVRCAICLMGAASVPGLVACEFSNSVINWSVASTVGAFAICCARLAFQSEKKDCLERLDHSNA